MAFIVNVRLVESIVKSSEGMDIVDSLMTKYKMVDVSCNIHRMLLAKRPSHEEDPWAWTTSLARVTADARSLGPPSPVVTEEMDSETVDTKDEDALAEAIL